MRLGQDGSNHSPEAGEENLGLRPFAAPVECVPCVGWDWLWEHWAGESVAFSVTCICLCEHSDGAAGKAEAVLMVANWEVAGAHEKQQI